MEIDTFKKELDSRNLWGVNSKEAFQAAYEWADKANENSNNQCQWSWDCGFKLDYDGELCNISSRFYPPHKYSAEYGKYHGWISVYVSEKQVFRKEIEAETLDKLKILVEKEVLELENKIKSAVESLFN
jgi:hypothetical protein